MTDSQRERVALITGASRGIGAHLVAAFVRDGYRVAGLSRTGDLQGDVGQGDAAVGYVCDVTDGDAVASVVEQVCAQQGTPSVVINNAGVVEPYTTLAESDPQEWRRVLEINVLGPYLVSRALIPHQRKVGGGCIININSGAATYSVSGLGAYCASKAALARLTSSIHVEEHNHGICVFDLAPGVVETDMTRGMPLHAERTDWTPPEAVCALALACASGELDAWSGKFLRAGAGADDTASAQAVADRGLAPHHRTLGLLGWGADDPVGSA